MWHHPWVVWSCDLPLEFWLVVLFSSRPACRPGQQSSASSAATCITLHPVGGLWCRQPVLCLLLFDNDKNAREFWTLNSLQGLEVKSETGRWRWKKKAPECIGIILPDQFSVSWLGYVYLGFGMSSVFLSWFGPRPFLSDSGGTALWCRSCCHTLRHHRWCLVPGKHQEAAKENMRTEEWKEEEKKENGIGTEGEEGGGEKERSKWGRKK